MESPTKGEVLDILEEYKIPELIGEEILTPTVRSKVDVYENLLYLVLRFPNARKEFGGKEIEVDFIIGSNFLITVHYELVDPLHNFSKVFEVNSVLNKDSMGNHAGYLFFFIMRELYSYTLNTLVGINADLRNIDKGIFAGKEQIMVHKISDVKRKILHYKQALRFHSDVLHSLEVTGRVFFGENFGHYLSVITDEYNKVRNELESHKEMLNDLRETNDSLLSTKTNQTIKRLTIITFVVLPVTLVASIFSMNTAFPILSTRQDYVIVLSGMLVLSIVMLTYFKLKKWL